jgi:hypothetical protein
MFLMHARAEPRGPRRLSDLASIEVILPRIGLFDPTQAPLRGRRFG